MSAWNFIRAGWLDLLSATQFLTRVPVPAHKYEADTLARSVKFFPVVGALVGCGAAAVHLVAAPHVPRLVDALVVVVYLVLITGGLHEDGLADSADGFGGGTNREKILLILRDSRIGSYGGIALVLSLVGRLVLIAAIPLAEVPYYLVAAQVLCRWSVLPLSYYLPAARGASVADGGGQGVRIARLISRNGLVGGTVFSVVAAAGLLKYQAVAPALVAVFVTWLCGVYFQRRLGGITGDCFGATIQLVEMGVYLCGAWTR